jgi:pseudouridine synthase
VNGKPAQLGESADAAADDITLDGRAIGRPLPYEYIALNKPAGFACTRHDPHLPRTVYDLLPRDFEPLFTVGRLDVDTEGLLLMTNDGEWANRVTHPRLHVPKVYLASVLGQPSPDDLARLRHGIALEDGITLPARVELIRRRADTGQAQMEITITEGRKRQVRRMLREVGLRVERLERIRVGPIALEDLPVGRWRRLGDREVQAMAREARG